MDDSRTDPSRTASSHTASLLPAIPDEVWEVLTSSEGVASWLGEGSSLPPVEGADLDVADTETGVRRLGRVETVEPGRRLGFVWWPADDGDDGAAGVPSRVDVTLTPEGPGTRLVVTETPLVPRASASMTHTCGDAWRWRVASMELRVAATCHRVGLTIVC